MQTSSIPINTKIIANFFVQLISILRQLFGIFT